MDTNLSILKTVSTKDLEAAIAKGIGDLIGAEHIFKCHIGKIEYSGLGGIKLDIDANIDFSQMSDQE